jgi:TolB-like protein
VGNRNSSRLPAGIGFVLLAILAGSSMHAAPVRARVAKVAIFPVQNLTSGAVPADELRQSLADALAAAGVTVIDDDVLEAFMARHRVRYTAGIDTGTAEALRTEAGVDAVAIASVEFWSEADPAKVALFARLVSISDAPTVIWADDGAMSGDDAPGLFELGLIRKPEVLLERALGKLQKSLTAYLKTERVPVDGKTSSTFRPKAYHRNLVLDPTSAHSVAVVPFFNLSSRRNAGEIMALHFIRHLADSPRFQVIDTGAIRQQLLDARIIMDGGLAISDADTVATLIQAEFVLTGCVFRYEDYEGPAGRTGVEFSALLIEKKTRKVVWSSDSYNDGRDTVGLFEHGGSKTAHAMATQMVSQTAARLAGQQR